MILSKFPIIRKAKCVVGKTLIFRDANESDAEFILSIRTDEKKSQFLNKTSHDLNLQKKWLCDYDKAKNQAYFIIEYKMESIGTVRLYDPQESSFCWGSWILKNNSPSHAAIESSLMIYSFAIDILNFDSSHFDVRKENERVWMFHERFGAKRIAEENQDYFYEIDKKSIQKSRLFYKKFLPENVKVNF